MTEKTEIQVFPVTCCVCGCPLQVSMLPQSVTENRNCSECGEAFFVRGNRIEWEVNGSKEQSEEKNTSETSQNLIRQIKRTLLFPLRWLNKIKVENYYQRTLHDEKLAAMWTSHYLKGLNLREGAEVFEHGCGRGRHIGLLNQAGFKTAGLDITSHVWWDNFPESCFQVVPADCYQFPWKDNQFDVAINFLAISHFSEENVEKIMKEMQRVLKPSGYFLLYEVNTESSGADFARKWYGRLHSFESIRSVAMKNGFQEIDSSIEGFAFPIFPQVFNFVRTILTPRSLTMMDYNSWLSKLLPEKKRDRWLLRLRKL